MATGPVFIWKTEKGVRCSDAVLASGANPHPDAFSERSAPKGVRLSVPPAPKDLRRSVRTCARPDPHQPGDMADFPLSRRTRSDLPHRPEPLRMVVKPEGPASIRADPEGSLRSALVQRTAAVGSELSKAAHRARKKHCSMKISWG